MWSYSSPRHLSLVEPLADTLDGSMIARRNKIDSNNNILTGLNPVEFSTSDPVRLFIIQAVIIVCFTRLLGWVGTYLRQPRVIAEVIGGILLGPTVFGRIPGFTSSIFPAPSLSYLNLVSTLGLILFLFLVGLEVDFRAVRKCYKEALAVGLTGLVVPFGLGAAISVGIYKDMIDHSKVSFGHFTLFTSVAIAITAFPVLARILTEQKLTQTKVGIIVLAAGVGNDVVGWILLALTIALVNASSGVVAVYILLIALGWVLFLTFLVRPVLIWFLRRTGALERGPSPMVLTATLILVLTSAWMTDVIGVHPIFGAFVVGLIIPHEGGFAVALVEKIEDLVSTLFLPIYFTLSGINTNLASLDNGTVWGYLVGVTTVAFTSKFLSCAAAAKTCGCNARESLAVGTLMSCKGLVELIVLNVGLNAKILDTRTFSMFVVMALVSTIATTPLTIWAYPASVRTTIDDQGNFQQAPPGLLDGSSAEQEGESESQTHSLHPPQDDTLALSLARPRRLRVVLDRLEHLPVLMTLVQFLGPVQLPHSFRGKKPSRESDTASFTSSYDGCKVDEREVVTDADIVDEADYRHFLSDPAPQQETIRRQRPRQEEGLLWLDTLRLLELTDRTSAVMRASATEDTLGSDDVWAVFQTACQLHSVPAKARVAVVNSTATDQAEAILPRSQGPKPDTILVPWSIPDDPFTPWSGGLATAGGEGGSGSGGGGGGGLSTSHQAHLIRKLQRHSSSTVATLLQRSLTRSSRARTLDTHHAVVAFLGGADARAALEMGLVLVAQNAAVKLTVLRLCSPCLQPDATSPGKNTDPPGQDAYEMHPTGTVLVDDLAFDRLSRYLSSSPADQRDRVQVIPLPASSHTLRTLLQHITTSQPGLVLVGRESGVAAALGEEQALLAEQACTRSRCEPSSAGTPTTSSAIGDGGRDEPKCRHHNPHVDDPDMLNAMGAAGWALHFCLSSSPFAQTGRQLPPTVILAAGRSERTRKASRGGASAGSTTSLLAQLWDPPAVSQRTDDDTAGNPVPLVAESSDQKEIK